MSAEEDKGGAGGGGAAGPRDDDDTGILMSDMDEGMVKAVGFTSFSELMNGRAAMIGFIAALGIELASGRGLLSVVADLTGWDVAGNAGL